MEPPPLLDFVILCRRGKAEAALQSCGRSWVSIGAEELAMIGSQKESTFRVEVFNRRPKLTQRIASSANVTRPEAGNVVFRCKGLLEKRACGRVGPFIARAVHRPGHVDA